MSEIKAADLVRVVKSCCDANVGTKRVFVVDGIEPGGNEKCYFCKSPIPIEAVAVSDGWAFNLSWLRKIDPPSTGEYDGVPVRKTEPKEVMA